MCIRDRNIASRVDSYLTNMKLPWEKQLAITVVSVGALELHIRVSEDELKFQKTWFKNYPTQVIVLCWERTLCYLGVGLDSGLIEVLKIPSETRFLKFSEQASIQAHTARVMGLYIEYSTGYILSLIHI
eukprot:TRINITY_DN9961_c0_g1_i3.p2 TRINITY_DN9961_c0_g1~~TRINITY_DN9961_c0_g1_i3.p2  ORF type:complete len:129 (-),score=20.28 TRINITY_DN9961_c0_g1_i3:58-444(-)